MTREELEAVIDRVDAHARPRLTPEEWERLMRRYIGNDAAGKRLAEHGHEIIGPGVGR